MILMVFLKKSQVTLFMAAGLVILFSFAIILLASSQVSKTALYAEISKTSDSSPQFFTQKCLETTMKLGLEWALFEFGSYKQGDSNSTARVYVVAHDASTDVKNPLVRRTIDFNKEMIQQSISLFFEDSFQYCIDNFSLLKEMGWEINYSAPQAEIFVEDYGVIADLKFPIESKKGKSSASLEDFSYQDSVNIADIISTTNKFIDESVSQNKLPEEYIDLLETTRNDLHILMTFLYEGWPETPYVEWILGFENSTHRVAFIINYDWYRSDATYKSIDELFNQTEAESK